MMLDKAIAIAIVLFLFSMISERIITWIKLQWGQLNKSLLGFSVKGEDLTVQSADPEFEKTRERRILGLNIVVSIIVAFIADADLMEIMSSPEPYKAIGWSTWACTFWIGCPLTGLFISLGSKFWHDLLDMLLEAKNYRRLLSDPDTYKIDKTATLDNLLTTYESDFIKAAYSEAKIKFLSREDIKAFSLKRDSFGFFFDITITKFDPSIGERYSYTLGDGTPSSIRLKFYECGDDNIVPHDPDLSSKVFNMLNDQNWGTLGCIVRPVDITNRKRFILTCCHNVIKPITNPPKFNSIAVGIKDEPVVALKIGTVVDGVWDSFMDAALIEIDADKVSTITPAIPQLAVPRGTKVLKTNDENKIAVSLFGARSELQTGIVTSIYASATVDYATSGSHELTGLIAVSNGNLAISKGGDSGCCVVDDQYRVIGLIVAGNKRESYIMPIEPLLTKFNVKMIS